MLQLVDIGLNLTHDSFDRDREEIVSRAAAAGVTRMIVTGTSVSASRQALDLAGSRAGALFATVGVHPHHAGEFDESAVGTLRALLSSSALAVAVGECGLDYFRDFTPRDAQQRAFASQLELAREMGLPVFLHQREAHATMIAMLREARSGLTGGVAHCFTGGPHELRDYLELDLYIGVTGWVCDERRGQALRAALPSIPLERLLLETDAPYLLPRDLPEAPRGRRNEPSFLPHILRRVAIGMGRLPEVVAAASTANAERLFRLSERSPAARAPGERPS